MLPTLATLARPLLLAAALVATAGAAAVAAEVTVYQAPEGSGPHDTAPAPDGKVWCAAQGAGARGHRRPRHRRGSAGPVGRGLSAPRRDLGPGRASLAGSRIAEIDTATGAKRRSDPQTRGQGARRVWSDSKGDAWVSEWSSGQFSRYAPAPAGAWKAWRLPGQAPRAYAVYVDPAATVWVSDFGANAVLGLDPATERFTAARPGSGPHADVRQILGREGEVFLPESGLDRAAVVRAGAVTAATPGG